MGRVSGRMEGRIKGKIKERIKGKLKGTIRRRIPERGTIKNEEGEKWKTGGSFIGFTIFGKSHYICSLVSK